MTSSMVVPVIDVQNDNFKELWPAMVLAIKTSSFIALDTELSGLGNRKALLAESIEDRYKAICHAARTRSILSLGLACYKKQACEPADTYLVQVYNLTLLCSEEYIIEPQSVQFLVQHGFDFNKQYAQGVPYCKGNRSGSDHCGVTIRGLFTEMLRARKPLILHNGLIDMVFLYQCFYAQLPERLGNFTADLSEMLPAGIYDTKYAVEFELRFTASYLEYAYKKCKLDNSRSIASGRAGAHVHLEFCQYTDQMSSYVDYRSCPAMTGSEGGQPSDVCLQFSAFGWCRNGSRCPRSHDTDLIILQDEQDKNNKRMSKKRKRERKRASAIGGQNDGNGFSVFDGAPEKKVSHVEMEAEEPPVPFVPVQGETSEPQPETVAAPGSPMAEDTSLESGTATVQSAQEENGTPQKNEDDSAAITIANAVNCAEGGRDVSGEKSAKMEAGKKQKLEAGSHRAGFDAFMTGYIFAHASALSWGEGGGEGQAKKAEGSWLPDCLNKVYLSGKAAPLQIVKSAFAKSSRAHMNMMKIVWGKDVADALADRAQQGNDQI